jgi:hypothetical protein
MGAIEIHGPSQATIDWGDGSVRVGCQNNLHDIVRAITSETPMNSIDALRITSPGIIAILIGLLLPAASEAREGTAWMRKSGGSPTTSGKEFLTFLFALRPYFAHDGQVELRAVKVATGDVNGDGLVDLAIAFGVPVLIGAADPHSGEWRGPVTKATPGGIIQKI